jgi:tetratricopeptide (TPR) repeat protein
MRGRILFPVVFACLVAAAAPAWSATQARVAGTVTDSAGAPIAKAEIIITSPELPNYRKTMQTDAKGGFRALILDATKSYLFRIEAPGYLAHEEPFKVGVGTMDNDFTFTLKTEQEVLASEQQKLLEQPGYKEFDEGHSLLEEGKRVEARAKFVEAAAVLPDLTSAWRAIAELDWENGDWEQALANARKCLETDDESTSCLAIAANSAKEIGDLEAHAEYMARYQDLNPDDPATLFNQAVTHLNAMDDESARPLLEQCLEADPEFPKCLFEYGMLLLRTGDMAGAKTQLEKYLEVAPDGPDATAAQDVVKYL